MCLAVLALGVSERFPLVVAANRDEYHDRPTVAMDWWTPSTQSSPILAGRDLQAGGTWLGLDAQARLALLTNIRDPRLHDPAAPSRGGIVTDWLAGLDPDDVLTRAMESRVNGFNLLALDAATFAAFHVTNRPAQVRPLSCGLVGLSNAGLDTPWPKVVALKSRVAETIAACDGVDALVDRLLDTLGDDARAPDHLLPSTGVTLEWERQLSSIFIRADDRRYGTRSSTVIVTERAGIGMTTHVVERSFEARGAIAGTRHFRLAIDLPAVQPE